VRLLVVAPNWIGDALMAQPLLGLLRARHAGARIEALAPPWVAPVLRRMPEVNEVIEADLRHGSLQLAERWRIARQFRERAYDRAIVLPNTWKSALVPLLAGIPARVGYGRPAMLSQSVRAGAKREAMPLHYARLAGEEPVTPLPAPRLTPRANETAARFGISGAYVALCPGAEYGPAKRWPYFRELAERLGVRAVVLGSPGDRESSAGIPGTNLVGRTTLDEAIDLIAGAHAVVTNDSGLMHVAAASGTPLVALFGSSSPEHTPPLSPKARVLWLQVECSPCFARQCPLGHFRCMKEMSVEQVLGELEALP
jgi:heptosyltransferase-2